MFSVKISNLKYSILIFLLTAVIFLLIPLNQLLADGLIIEEIEAVRSGEESITVKWRTNISSRGTLRFSVNGNGLENVISESQSLSASRWHEVKLDNLKADSDYFYQIYATGNNQEIKSFVKKFSTHDLKIIEDAPMIKDLEVFYISATAAALRWKTDMSATSYVEYGTEKDYKKKVTGGQRTLEHTAIITKLVPEKKYYVRIFAINKDNVKSSEHYREFTTRTQGVKNEGSLSIYDFRPNSQTDPLISVHSIAINFKTNNLAKGYVDVSAKGLQRQRFNFTYNTNHRLYLDDLLKNFCYKFDIRMDDIFRNNTTDSFTVCTQDQESAGYQTHSTNAAVTEFNTDTGKTSTFTASDKKSFSTTDDVVDLEVLVLGTQYAHFTPASALLSTADSPKVYAILNKQRQPITSLEAFNDYGFNWSQVKKVDWPQIAKYKEVRLARSAENNRVYFLWRRADGTTMKIGIPSPAVFGSYPKNSWADVVKISKFDVANYPDVRLVRAEGSLDIYFLSDGTKHFVSQEKFRENKFSMSDVLVINQTHLNEIRTGEYYK